VGDVDPSGGLRFAQLSSVSRTFCVCVCVCLYECRYVAYIYIYTHTHYIASYDDARDAQVSSSSYDMYPPPHTRPDLANGTYIYIYI
jgi:hypothetical protein